MNDSTEFLTHMPPISSCTVTSFHTELTVEPDYTEFPQTPTCEGQLVWTFCFLSAATICQAQLSSYDPQPRAPGLMLLPGLSCITPSTTSQLLDYQNVIFALSLCERFRDCLTSLVCICVTHVFRYQP